MRKHNKSMAQRSGLTENEAKELGVTRQQIGHQLANNKAFQFAANTLLGKLVSGYIPGGA